MVNKAKTVPDYPEEGGVSDQGRSSHRTHEGTCTLESLHLFYLSSLNARKHFPSLSHPPTSSVLLDILPDGQGASV